MPRMPSNFAKRNARPGSRVASANVWPSIDRPAHPSVSSERKPLSDPLPYWMAKSVPSGTNVVERAPSNLECKSHGIWRKLHLLLGIHRLLLPVSNTTWKDCGGVPRVMAPKYCASM